MFTRNIARTLRAGTALSALTLATSLLAVPAFAQDTAPTPSTDQTAPATPAADEAPEIVVTGSLFATKVTASPVTTVTAESLDARGITTVQDGLQRLAANNGPTLTNSFSANGAFAGGASAISLRGLSTNSTLVLFDGLRAAYYPLADDATRNFVDLNTIPDDIIDRIEVLKDGASSSYGADAIAGVVNIITKRSFTGISARAEAGVSQNGIAATQRLSVTAGTGDLDRDGFNAYISAFYYHADSVSTKDLPYPFNSDNQTGIGGPNNLVNAENFAPTYAGSNVYVAPGAGGRYQLLQNGCVNGNLTQTTAAQQAADGMLPTSICQQDLINQYGVVAPQIDRFGFSAHVAKTLGDSAEAYLEVNFQQSRSQYSGLASSIYANAPAGIYYAPYSTRGSGAAFAAGSGALTLPVYVCAARVNCTAANGTLNPNNPFAATGDTATVIGAMPNLTRFDETRSRVYRAAAGIKGSFGDDWNYKVDATAMHTDLRRTSEGYIYIQHLLDVIADGSYNFVNPSANSQSVLNYLAPTLNVDASSDLYQIQASVNKSLFQLPGGPVQVALGGSLFYEAVDSPSANSDVNGPTERYFTINAFGTEGHRTVASAFGEVSIPVFKQLELNASGRYDHYSTGQSTFSPKVGAKFTPFDMLTLRGNWSRGFRIPSFGEANALPTTGYVTNSAGLFNDAYLSQYGCTVATFSTACPQYLRTASYGATTLASPDLKPEKSRSITLGAVFQPMRNVSLSVDYFNIKKTDAITSLSSAAALQAYYAGEAIPTGYTIIADAVDPAHPGALPRVAYVQSHYVNANTMKSEGIDFGANARFRFGDVTWTSNLDATLLLELSTTLADGTRETYVDTIGNYNLTAGSGTYRWKGSWMNSFAIGNYTLTGTANYTSGYDLSAMDQGNAYEDCGLAPSPAYTGCRVKSYFTFDLNATAKIADKFTIYANVLNLFDRLPDVDPVTYGAYLYNPVQAGEGIYGRRFTVGAKVNF
ncbi:TonB-dependent receptor [Sphingomonas sp. R-74633]|uniref:TonB-dependent receptor domain-containing protein n=1 Tax=Sphingomonas sp. R-74633 TaxID=2751188 RepID=UPI0015D16457|nr:TonB-dependent receptor [Sphingomonas sp. R-74633]NYT41603.1 TonB-dependent receptor [Sphingomonas sp. R-74633]